VKIETDNGTHEIEFSLEAIKKMEFAGLRPLKILSDAGDDPEGMKISDVTAMLDLCATSDVTSLKFTEDLEKSGYGLGDILQIFSEVFAKSPFLTNRRLTPALSECASQTERIGSGTDT